MPIKTEQSYGSICRPCPQTCLLYFYGFELRFAKVSHVGPWLGGFEGGLGSVGFGQRQLSVQRDVRVGTCFGCGVLAIR